MEQKKTAYTQDLKGYRAMAVDLMDYLRPLGLWDLTAIGTGKQIWASDPIAGEMLEIAEKNRKKAVTQKGTEYYIYSPINIREIDKYADPKAMTLFFYDNLCVVINDQDDGLVDVWLEERGYTFDQFSAHALYIYPAT